MLSGAHGPYLCKYCRSGTHPERLAGRTDMACPRRAGRCDNAGAQVVIRKLAAIMAVDMVGFSGLMERAEEATLARQIEQRKSVFYPLIEQAGGRIVKTTGDGYLADFPSVVECVQCAVKIQERLADSDTSAADDPPLCYRIGIHLGDVIMEDGDIFGDGVNLAARLEGIAPAGGVCISGAAHDQLQGEMASCFKDMGQHTVKNIERPIRVYSWRGMALSQAQGAASGSRRRKPTVRLAPFQAIGGQEDAQLLAEGCQTAVSALLTGFTGIDHVEGDAPALHVVHVTFQTAGAEARAVLKILDTRDAVSYLTSRFSADLSDIFAAQDELAGEIASTVRYGIQQREAEKSVDLDDDDVEGMLNRAGHLMMGSVMGEWEEAALLLDRIIELDPDNFMALAMRANIPMREILWGYRELTHEQSENARANLTRATRINSQSDFLNMLWAIYHIGVLGDLETAKRYLDRSLEISPQFALALMIRGLLQTLSGDAQAGIESCKLAATSLSKNRIHHRALGYLALCNLVAGDHEAAIDAASRALQQIPDYLPALLILASASARAGLDSHCDRTVHELMLAYPDFRISDMRRLPFKDPGIWDRHLDALRQAGLPE